MWAWAHSPVPSEVVPISPRILQLCEFSLSHGQRVDAAGGLGTFSETERPQLNPSGAQTITGSTILGRVRMESWLQRERPLLPRLHVLKLTAPSFFVIFLRNK